MTFPATGDAVDLEPLNPPLRHADTPIAFDPFRPNSEQPLGPIEWLNAPPLTEYFNAFMRDARNRNLLVGIWRDNGVTNPHACNTVAKLVFVVEQIDPDVTPGSPGRRASDALFRLLNVYNDPHVPAWTKELARAQAEEVMKVYF